MNIFIEHQTFVLILAANEHQTQLSSHKPLPLVEFVHCTIFNIGNNTNITHLMSELPVLIIWKEWTS